MICVHLLYEMNCEAGQYFFPTYTLQLSLILIQLSLFYSTCYEVFVSVTTVRKVILFVAS